jgi:hypothetical protein
MAAPYESRHTSPSVPSSPAPTSPTITAVALPGGEEPPSLFPLTLVEEDNEDYAPVSPGTAQTILRLAPNGTDATILATAFGLATTVQSRMTQYAQQLAESAEQVAQLERIVGAREADNRQLRARLGVLAVPPGFERNDRRIATRVPTGRGQMVVPTYIRSVGDGTVELLARREQGEPTYVAELYLRPDHTENTVTETAPGWFIALLCSRDGGFHTLIEEVRRLNNPGALAEAYRYRELEQERDNLVSQQNLITDQLSSIRDCIDVCRYQMEAGQLPTLMRHLEGRNTFVPHIRPQLARSRRATRICHIDDGAST